jgi:dCMP deaminase
MIQPLKAKYWPMYFNMAYAAQMQTEAKREKVGCVIVTPSGVVLPGYNGQPPGHHTNCCENTPVEENGIQRLKTDTSVIHAEDNAINKAFIQGIDLTGSHIFSTVSPCPGCSQLIVDAGIAVVHYDRHHDDMSGHSILDAAGVVIVPR